MHEVRKLKVVQNVRIILSVKEATKLLKLSLNKKDLDDVTAVPFPVSFSQLPEAKINA